MFVTRPELILKIRQHADMVGSTFVTDVELASMIDTSTRALYDLLIRSFGDEYWSQVLWFNVCHPAVIGDPNIAWPNPAVTVDEMGAGGEIVTTDVRLANNGPASSFFLPSSVYKILRVGFVRGTATSLYTGTPPLETYTDEWRVVTSDKEIFPIHRIDSPGQIISLHPTDWTQTRVAYRLRRGPHRYRTLAVQIDAAKPVIDFLPIPPAGAQYAVQLMYVPEVKLLADDTSYFYYPHEDYIEYDVAAKCLKKQQQDASALDNQKLEVMQRIVTQSSPADVANAPMVVDVYGGNQLGSPGFVPWL